MATQSLGSQRRQIGSRAWITAEKENTAQLTAHEIEEAMYPAQYEMEWLNECMTDIFSGEMDFTEILKTPGALRGKTPRSSKKAMATPRGLRAPLRAPFSSDSRTEKNARSTAPRFGRELSQIRESDGNATTQTLPKDEKTPSEQPDADKVRQRDDENHPADSGYLELASIRDKEKAALPISHTMSFGISMPTMVSTTPSRPPPRLLRKDSETRQRGISSTNTLTTDNRTSKRGSTPKDSLFHQDAVYSKTGNSPMRSTLRHQNAVHLDNDSEPEEVSKTPFMNTRTLRREISTDNIEAPESHPHSQNTRTSSRLEMSMSAENHNNIRETASPDELHFPVSQHKSLARSSSERSISRVDIDNINGSNSDHGYSRLSRISYTKDDSRVSTNPNTAAEVVDVDDVRASYSRGLSAGENSQENITTKRETKTSTQLLHERISMLGQSRTPRLSKSKSITSSQPFQVHYPDLSQSRSEFASNPEGRDQGMRKSITMNENDEHESRSSRAKTSTSQATEYDDGRQKIGDDEPRQQARTQRASSEAKSSSTTRHPSTEDLPDSMPRSPSPVRAFTNDAKETATLQTTPSRFGKSLTASKHRLQSIMKSAKGIFSSGASRADEPLDNWPEMEDESNPKSNVTYPHFESHMDDVQIDQRPETPTPTSPKDDQTKDSMDREQYTPDHMESDEDMSEESVSLAKSRPGQTANAPTSTVSNVSQPGQVRPQGEQDTSHAPTDTEQPTFQSSRQSNTTSTDSVPDHRRPAPAKKPLPNTQKTRPGSLNIRLGALPSQRIQKLNNLPTESETKNNTTTVPRTGNQKPNNPGLQSAGSRTSNLASSQVRAKGTVSAQAMKEQERETQRKAPAATGREKENTKEREPAEKSNEPRKPALQAIERGRLENAAKKLQLQQQQQTQTQARTRQAAAASRSSTDVTQKQPTQRASVTQPPARPTSRLGSMTSAPSFKPGGYLAPNTSKSTKRPLEEDQGATGSRLPARKPSVIQQVDGKRRRTEEEADISVKPTMAPPIRQSAVRKIPPPQRPPSHGLPRTGLVRKPSTSATVRTQTQKTSLANNAPRHFQQPASHGPQNRHPGHPLDMSKYANGKIPFADTSANHQTPASKNALSQPQSSHPQSRPKSSPMYPNGDNISLPDIDSGEDSDDSDAEEHGIVPDWAQPDKLHDLLVQQEGEDGENVFGPSAPLRMEEIFKDSKHRHRFRDRTSSANWNGPDGLTREEILKDIEARERLKRNGGWAYGI